jgi:hypothetical protein
MSKIIFSLICGLPQSNRLPCLYEGFVNALMEEGNEVLVIINNNIISNCWKKNESVNDLDKDKLNKKILNFNPDLVIAWNNSLYEEIPNIVSCPIIIYGTDSPAVFSDREILKDNIGRYNIIVASEQFIGMVQEYFSSNYRSLDVVRFATDFKAETLKQDKNISFIGTNFDFASVNFKKLFFDNFNEEKRRKFRIFYNSFLQDIFKKPESHLQKNLLDLQLIGDISHIDLLNLISSNNRIQTLATIADLGLALYGGKNWLQSCDYSLPLALSFIDKEVTSIKDNQDIYNSSKISINISHAQAGNAFSWRVRDIMACNSALISDPRKDLETEFGKYVKIPTYENPFEARKICEKLLKDEKWRQEIISGSQLAIEENNRFKHRFKDIEQIVGVKLFCGTKGSIEFLNNSEFFKVGFLQKMFCDLTSRSENNKEDSKQNNSTSQTQTSKINPAKIFPKPLPKSFSKRLNRKRINFCRKLKGKIICKYCGAINH